MGQGLSCRCIEVVKSTVVKESMQRKLGLGTRVLTIVHLLQSVSCFARFGGHGDEGEKGVLMFEFVGGGGASQRVIKTTARVRTKGKVCRCLSSRPSSEAVTLC